MSLGSCEAEIERLRAEIAGLRARTEVAERRAGDYGRCVVSFVRGLTNRHADGSVEVCLPVVIGCGSLASVSVRCVGQDAAIQAIADHFGLDKGSITK